MGFFVLLGTHRLGRSNSVRYRVISHYIHKFGVSSKYLQLRYKNVLDVKLYDDDNPFRRLKNIALVWNL